MFCDFKKFKEMHKQLNYINCKECNDVNNCNRVELISDGSYQPKDNKHYFKKYGCYKIIK